jgi:hypothetical protein
MMLEAFEALGQEYGFVSIDANQPIGDVFVQLRDAICSVVQELKADESPRPEEAAIS